MNSYEVKVPKVTGRSRIIQEEGKGWVEEPGTEEHSFIFVV